MRLIDADAYKKHLASFVVGGEKAIVKNGIGNYWINGIHTAYREIDNVPTIKTFTLADIEEQYRNGLEKGLEESREERDHIISWLSKFCLHIDMADKHLSDAEALEFWKKKMNQQFGWGEGEAE